MREAVGQDFIVMYRLSMLRPCRRWKRLVGGGNAGPTRGARRGDHDQHGIGWHETRIPTIATMVPRGGFQFVTKKLMGKVQVPL